MTYLAFLAFALGGFFISMMVLGLVLPVLFSGEVWPGYFFPLIELVCLAGFSIPFALVQQRLTISVTARKLLPFFYGLFSFPLFILSGVFPVAHENVWVSVFRLGAIGTPVSFAIAYGLVKLVDLALKRMEKVEREKMEQEEQENKGRQDFR